MTSNIKATESYPLEHLVQVAKEFQKNIKAKKRKSHTTQATSSTKAKAKQQGRRI